MVWRKVKGHGKLSPQLLCLLCVMETFYISCVNFLCDGNLCDLLMWNLSGQALVEFQPPGQFLQQAILTISRFTFNDLIFSRWLHLSTCHTSKRPKAYGSQANGKFAQDKPIQKMMKKLLKLGFVDPDEWHHVQMKWAREAGENRTTRLFQFWKLVVVFQNCFPLLQAQDMSSAKASATAKAWL